MMKHPKLGLAVCVALTLGGAGAMYAAEGMAAAKHSGEDCPGSNAARVVRCETNPIDHALRMLQAENTQLQGEVVTLRISVDALRAAEAAEAEAEHHGDGDGDGGGQNSGAGMAFAG